MKNKINDLNVSGGVSWKNVANGIKKTVGIVTLASIGVVAERKFHVYDKTKSRLKNWANSD